MSPHIQLTVTCDACAPSPSARLPCASRWCTTTTRHGAGCIATHRPSPAAGTARPSPSALHTWTAYEPRLPPPVSTVVRTHAGWPDPCPLWRAHGSAQWCTAAQAGCPGRRTHASKSYSRMYEAASSVISLTSTGRPSARSRPAQSTRPHRDPADSSRHPGRPSPRWQIANCPDAGAVVGGLRDWRYPSRGWSIRTPPPHHTTRIYTAPRTHHLKCNSYMMAWFSSSDASPKGVPPGQSRTSRMLPQFSATDHL